MPARTHCVNCEEKLHFTSQKGEIKPEAEVPYRSLSSLLQELLSQPGMEDEMDRWKTDPPRKGRKREMYHGRVWDELRTHDGEAFFDPDQEDELRIGLTISLDWSVI